VATGKYCAVALLRIVEMVALHDTNTRTIQQTPMFHGCTITNLNITINK
jgi:hypothetical protein